MLHRRIESGPVAGASGVRWRDSALLAYARAFEHPSKIRIVRWLVRRLAAGRIQVRYASGAVVAIDPADYVGWAIFKTGHYEPTSLSLALRIMREEPGLFVDVGANFGWYTCAVAATSACTVISIEPDCENCASLRRNIALGNRSHGYRSCRSRRRSLLLSTACQRTHHQCGGERQDKLSAAHYSFMLSDACYQSLLVLFSWQIALRCCWIRRSQEAREASPMI